MVPNWEEPERYWGCGGPDRKDSADTVHENEEDGDEKYDTSYIAAFSAWNIILVVFLSLLRLRV